ncbi:MAG TPA: SGNH/GDSL hydrolase family protein, partial [Pedobacter sp.]
TDEFSVDTTALTMPKSNGLAVDISPFSPELSPTIVILGSSTAEGIGATDMNLSWAGLLKAKLTADNKGVNVINLALHGQTTSDIMPSKVTTAFKHNKPNIKTNITSALLYRPLLVIINLPTNDIAFNFSDEEILDNFATIIGAIDSAKTNYIITGTQPRNFGRLEDRKRLKVLNDKLNKLYPDHFVDVLRKLSKQTYLIADYYAYNDGIHLNDHGHRTIFQYIFNTPLFQKLIGYD